ncbi:TPA: tellurite resistance TerB family protein [Klebsiella variicola]|uniref:tellurite resistance TerB family protein n=1 Tax=Klebsiella quasipneumoniae TaxID=1463165 RepID=UPI002B1780D8|nr:tellurite resistance TerB family protein [Klebsiella variicola]
MFGFGKKARKAAAEIKKFEKRDLAQAVINAAWLVAYADGECSNVEKASVDQVLRANPVLGAFTSEIQGISQTIIAQLDANYKVGRLAAYREIEDCKGDQREAEDVLVTAIAIAEADGDIQEAEKKVLEEIANRLGLRLETYLD